MMKDFKFDYDSEYDDLFVYSDKKSDGAVEIGDFVFDFCEDGEFTGFQIQNASKNLQKITGKSFENLSELKDCKINVNNIRNFLALNISLIYQHDRIDINLMIPSTREENKILV